MRAIWKGSISFGLVNIPIALYPATRKEELKFRLLRATDHSPVNYKRVAEADGVGILLNHGLDDLFGRLVKPRVDDLHTSVAQRASDYLGPAIVTVEAGFADEDSLAG